MSSHMPGLLRVKPSSRVLCLQTPKTEPHAYRTEALHLQHLGGNPGFQFAYGLCGIGFGGLNGELHCDLESRDLGPRGFRV